MIPQPPIPIPNAPVGIPIPTPIPGFTNYYDSNSDSNSSGP